MRFWFTLVSLAAASVVVLAACGTATPTATPTPTDGPNARADAAVQAYLALMDKLAIELTWFSNPDGPGGSTGEVIDLASKLEAYIPFFAALDRERREYVLSTYRGQLEETSTRVAALAVAAHEITGNEAMVAALQRTPAFAIAFTDDGDSPQAQLLRAKSRWERSGITAYTYTTAQQCFCPQDYVAPVAVDVRDGVVQGVAFADGRAGDVPDPQRFGTVDDLFAKLQDAIDRGAVSITVEYERQLGYPTTAFIDYDALIADEEQGFAVSELTAR